MTPARPDGGALGSACLAYREGVSAELDGEAPPDGFDRVHAAMCVGCATYIEAYGALHRRLRVRPAPTVPDLADAIVASVRSDRAHDLAAARRAVAAGQRSAVGDGRVFQIGLFTIAIVQVCSGIAAIAARFSGDLGHAHRELGAWELALGCGLAFAAYRPHAARGMLAVLFGLVAGSVGVSILDIAAGRVAAIHEANHFAAPIGLGLLLMATRRPEPARSRAAGTRRTVVASR